MKRNAFSQRLRFRRNVKYLFLLGEYATYSSLNQFAREINIKVKIGREHVEHHTVVGQN